MAFQKCSIKDCFKIILPKDTKIHEKTCKHRIVACPLSKKLKCPDSIKIKNLREHIKNVHVHPNLTENFKLSKKIGITWVISNPKNTSDGNPKYPKDSKKRVCVWKKINGQDLILLIETDNTDRKYKITPLSLEKPKDAEKYKVQITALHPENSKMNLIWLGQINDVFDDNESKQIFIMTEEQKRQLTKKVDDKNRTSFEVNIVRIVPKKTMVGKFMGTIKKFLKSLANKY